MQKEKEVLLQLAGCLIEFLKLDSSQTQEYLVLQYIAESTIREIEAGSEALEFTSKQIQKGVVPHPDESQSSTWLNNIYNNKIEQKLKLQIQRKLSSYARSQGLTSFPWINKQSTSGGAGNASTYKLVGLLLLDNELRESDRFQPQLGEIKYTAVKEIQATRFAKIMFGKQLIMADWRKWLMAFYPLINMIGLTLIGYLLFMGLLLKSAPLTSRDIALVITLYLGFVMAKSYKDRADRFLDDGIIMASEWFMKFKENDVLQEMVRVKDENGDFLHKEVRLTKYVSTCNVCEGKVYLDEGEPDYPRRIIGRCLESPREHVYSFDRVTLIGKPLN